MVDWNYYDKFGALVDTYMPLMGEGDTVATQMVTAVNKLVYKWYNDGDTFDNTTYNSEGANDLSSYANWLYKYCADCNADKILDRIKSCYTEDSYEQILKDLADAVLNEKYILAKHAIPKCGSIYECDGKFKFVEYYDDEYEYYAW